MTWKRGFLCDRRACEKCDDISYDLCFLSYDTFHAKAEIEINSVTLGAFVVPKYWPFTLENEVEGKILL